MTYSFLLALTVVFLFPFVIAIVTSFKTDPNATAHPLSVRPSPATGAAYHDLFHSQDFPRWFMNSATTSSLVCDSGRRVALPVSKVTPVSTNGGGGGIRL